jgi:hypothetical protein
MSLIDKTQPERSECGGIKLSGDLKIANANGNVAQRKIVWGHLALKLLRALDRKCAGRESK